MTDSHKGGTKSENVADSWEEAGDEEKDQEIAKAWETVEYSNERGYDCDVLIARILDQRDRFRHENLYLRQKMYDEGWRFLGFYITDPEGRQHPFFWGLRDEPDPSEDFFRGEEGKEELFGRPLLTKEENLEKEEKILKEREREIKLEEQKEEQMRAKLELIEEGKEEALKATEKFLDERKKEIELRKQKEEELLKAREAAQQMQEQGANADKPTFQILKRPTGCETQQSSSQQVMTKHDEKSRTLTFQEKEAAYWVARERIFGGNYRSEDEPDAMLDPNLQIPGAVGGIPAGLPSIHAYRAPTPRPRLPAAVMRTPRPPLYQQPPPLGMPPFGMAPLPPHAYAAPLPPMAQQRFPVAASIQHPNVQPQQQQRFPYFDSRIPPPATLPSPYVGQNPGQNPMGINPTYNDPVRNNPVPYGRPPAQLLSQNQFTPAFNDQPKRFF